MPIHSALVAIQQELKAPKNQRNNFGNYNYRSAEDILEAVKPLLKKNGCHLIMSDEPLIIGDWHYIKATATLVDAEETISVSAVAREASEKKGMDASQVTGATSSYARKYALNGLFAIDDNKDADTMDNRSEGQKQAPKAQTKPKTQDKEYAEKQTLLKAIAKKANEKGIATSDLSLAAKFVYSTPTKPVEKVGELGLEDLKEFSEKFETFVEMAKSSVE